MTINYLSFELPPFVRTKWTSETARSVWEGRLSAIGGALQRVFFRQIRHDLRAETGWRVAAIAEQHRSIFDSIDCPHRVLDERQTAALQLPRLCTRNTSYVAFGPTELIEDLDAGLFRRPSCCIGAIDNTIVHDAAFPYLKGRSSVFSSLETHHNVFWSPLNLTLSTHILCGPRCSAEEEALEILAELEVGYSDEHRWLVEILSWPLSWTSLHGIAEVKTPILTFCHNARPTAERISIRVEGTGYPAEGARGRGFPFRQRREPLRVVQ